MSDRSKRTELKGFPVAGRMSRMKTALLFALVFALPAPLAANGVEKPGPRTGTMVCRDVEQTGSRLSTRRVCMTKEQWEDSRRQTQAEVQQGQERLMSACPPNTRC
jgi:hypothetical protein